MSYLGVFVIGMVVGHLLGWQSAHQTVLAESERLGAFFVGSKTVVVKEIKQEDSAGGEK